MKHLVLLSYGASGTNALVDRLFNNDHIFVHKDKEPLNLGSKWNRDEKLKKGKITWIQKIESLIQEAGNKKLLIHIKPWHLTLLDVSHEEAVDYLKDNFEFIFLERLNYLAVRCCSKFKTVYRKGRASGWCADDARLDKTVIHLKLEEIELATATNEKLKDLIKDYNHICITYEDHIKLDPRIGADIITKHFNIHHDYDYKRYRMVPWARKNRWSDIKLANKIVNFDSLKKELINTKYEWMLWE